MDWDSSLAHYSLDFLRKMCVASLFQINVRVGYDKMMVFFLSSICFISSAMSEPVVYTKSGTVVGHTILMNDITVDEYLGIPFAQPPVGPLRFQKTLSVEPWPEPIIAKDEPPACIQYAFVPFTFADSLPGKSEDCLYLNIFVPSSVRETNQKKAVMFWLYGGSFAFASNRKPLHDGRSISSVGDVIVVTANYRLGEFGFLYSASEDAPGNVAFYDMIEALKWVNNNIEAFGGDTSSITVFGGSAGAIAIGLLCVSPLSRNLFQRAIMQSGGVSFAVSDGTRNLQLAQKLAKAVGCATDTKTIQADPKTVVNCLRYIDAMTLTIVLSSFAPFSSLNFMPQIGDEFMPFNPNEAIVNGNFQSVDVLIGNTLDEASFIITNSQPDVFGFYGEKNPQINKSFGEIMMKTQFGGFRDPDAVIEYYLGNLTEYDYDEVRRQVYTAMGDYVFNCPGAYFAERFSDRNNVFYYLFAHRPSNSPWAPWMGVVHFDELEFVFGLPLRTEDKYSRNNYTTEEALLSAEMITMWSDFAKYGRPSPANKQWPLYSKENPEYIVLDTSFENPTGRKFHGDNCEFFRPYFGF